MFKFFIVDDFAWDRLFFQLLFLSDPLSSSECSETLKLATVLMCFGLGCLIFALPDCFSDNLVTEILLLFEELTFFSVSKESWSAPE